MKPISFLQFLQVGREQWIVQRNPWARFFFRLFGPLGVHARIRNTRVINTIRRLNLPDRACILDAGCGHAYATFWLARHYPQYKFWAIDADPKLIAEGKQIASRLNIRNIQFIQADICKLKIKDLAIFDLIFSIDLLEHIEDDVGLLRALREAINPCGYLVLHLPRRHQEHRRFFSVFKSHTTPDHVRDEYTAREIHERLSWANFEVEGLYYGFSGWGELAFELNNLFWRHRWLRIMTALATYPICVGLAYMDTRQDYTDGNSLLVIARPIPTAGTEASDE